MPPRAVLPPALQRLLLVALLACSPGEPGEVAGGVPSGEPAPAADTTAGARPAILALDASPVGAPGDTARWTAHTVEQRDGDCQREGIDDAPVPCVEVSITYPELTAAPSPALADSARAFVERFTRATVGEGEPASSAEQMAARFVALRAETAAELGAATGVWSLERAVTVACNTPAVLSLRADEVQYSGGAHGNQMARLVTFDARTGARLRLRDVLRDSVAATRVAERLFREQRDIRPLQTLADAGFVFFEDERFALTENFLLCNDTLTFRYDPYEIAPYALGPTELLVPLGALR